jgi:hypothetical protein
MNSVSAASGLAGFTNSKAILAREPVDREDEVVAGHLSQFRIIPTGFVGLSGLQCWIACTKRS